LSPPIPRPCANPKSMVEDWSLRRTTGGDDACPSTATSPQPRSPPAPPQLAASSSAVWTRRVEEGSTVVKEGSTTVCPGGGGEEHGGRRRGVWRVCPVRPWPSRRTPPVGRHEAYAPPLLSGRPYLASEALDPPTRAPDLKSKAIVIFSR
jgi:hypothetical protein